ncbi:MAG TPA: tRNA pseudouridine(38-40) synthase TruA [Pseudonocardiaceae bacterium]|nr:tRNA pseudouridine(38-40) synthase TruA [Pseudonocardiaceae bacterium]
MTDLVRLRLDVAYDGTEFAGWAAQPGHRTVQGTLESALTTVLRLAGARLTVAGRTDAGVHARGQVCHVDLPAEALSALTGERLAHRLARLLPDDVRVRRVALAPTGFDARFSAIWRRYTYRVCDDPTGPDPLYRRTVLWWPRRLDGAAMDRAAERLLGEHDFAAFCRQRAGATTIRRLHELSWDRADSLLSCRVVADAFCHNMVRALVGCLLAVGEVRQREDWPAVVLKAGVRDPAAPVLPPHGLTLEEVGYPDDADLAARARDARSIRSPA